jgi:hypothetical protein
MGMMSMLADARIAGRYEAARQLLREYSPALGAG